MNVLKMNPCDDEFSFVYEDGNLTIQNGIQGSTTFVSSSVVMLTDCSDDLVCDNPMKRSQPEQLTIWGDVVDCCSNEKQKITLNPSDFGYSTPEELQTAIKQSSKVPGEILTIEKETLYTLGGKPIYRTALRVSGFTPGDGYVHNLNIDNYVSVKMYGWDADSPFDKRELSGEGTGQTTWIYGDLLTNEFDEIITDTDKDELLIILEYTKL